MSEENVEILRRVGEALSARTVPERLITTDVRFENVNTAVTNQTYVGVAGVRDWMNDLFDAFGEGARFEIAEIVAAEDDVVVAVLRLVGEGANSGAPLIMRWASVIRLRSGKIASGVSYASRREALEAAGLSE
jgi:ketosteroid isomerase-like protein